MQNPLESEEAAFRFVLGTIVYFAVIVVAAWIETWLGVIVFAVMTVGAFVVLRRGTASEPLPVSTERAEVEDTHRILVVTDAVVVGPRLREAILVLAASATEDVLLICAVAPPAAVGDGRSALDPVMSEQLETTLQELRAAGINARGALAADDPLSALEDALRGFDADEVVIAMTHNRPTAMSGASLSVESAQLSVAVAEDLAEAARSQVEGRVTMVVEDGLS